MTYISNLGEVLAILRPNAVWSVDDNGEEQVVEYAESNELPYPTEAELLAAEETYLAQKTATQYQIERRRKYPSLADLADALYWSNQGNNTKLDEYYAKVSAVKTKYPKP